MSRVQFPEKIEPLFMTKKRFNFVEGGRVSSKTWGVSGYVCLESAKGARSVCGREIASSIDHSLYTVLVNTIDRMKVPGYTITEKEIRHKSGGLIFFKGLKGGSKTETRTRVKGLEDVDIGWFEESEAMTQEMINLITPTIRKKGSRQIFTYNRFLETDPIHKFCLSLDADEKLHININYWDNPFCPEDEMKRADRMKEDDYDLWLHVYGGQPVKQGDNAVISRSDVYDAISRNIEPEGGISVGADIARFGDDKIVFFKRHGIKVIDYKVYSKLSITETSRKLIEFIDSSKGVNLPTNAKINHNKIPVKIDDTGLGGGVTDYVRDQRYHAIPVNFGGKPKDKNSYADLASEMWFEFNDQINEVDIPEIKELIEELTGRLYNYTNKEQKKVERKDDFKKRYGRSPDYADALLLCYYNPRDMYHGPIHFI